MTPPESTPGEDPEEEPSWLALLKWSALMFLAALLVAAISIPLLRWFGVEWGD